VTTIDIGADAACLASVLPASHARSRLEMVVQLSLVCVAILVYVLHCVGTSEAWAERRRVFDNFPPQTVDTPTPQCYMCAVPDRMPILGPKRLKPVFVQADGHEVTNASTTAPASGSDDGGVVIRGWVLGGAALQSDFSDSLANEGDDFGRSDFGSNMQRWGIASMADARYFTDLLFSNGRRSAALWLSTVVSPESGEATTAAATGRTGGVAPTVANINALAAPARGWFAPQTWSAFSIQVVVMIGAAAFYQMTVVAMLLRPAQHGVLRAVVGGIQ
jgi:hypothetical protein